ncbi:MAG: aminoglycoside phosphotransferase, partial [Comamonas sp.]
MSDPNFPTSSVVWADTGRQTLFEQWLAGIAQRHALQADSLRPASADASFRRYLRIDTQAG